MAKSHPVQTSAQTSSPQDAASAKMIKTWVERYTPAPRPGQTPAQPSKDNALRQALRPFAKLAEQFQEHPATDRLVTALPLTVGDLLKAQKALKKAALKKDAPPLVPSTEITLCEPLPVKHKIFKDGLIVIYREQFTLSLSAHQLHGTHSLWTCTERRTDQLGREWFRHCTMTPDDFGTLVEVQQ